MTKRLTEVFNMSSEDQVDDAIDDFEDTSENSTDVEEMIGTALEEYSSGVSVTSKIDAALPIVTELNTHDQEMDEIHQKAMGTFDDLVSLAMNSDSHSGSKFLESATSLLKTAMEAKDSKVDRKLKMVNLQIQSEKLKLAKKKQDSADGENEIEVEGSVTFDRNEILKRLSAAEKENSVSENDENDK